MRCWTWSPKTASRNSTTRRGSLASSSTTGTWKIDGSTSKRLGRWCVRGPTSPRSSTLTCVRTGAVHTTTAGRTLWTSGSQRRPMRSTWSVGSAACRCLGCHTTRAHSPSPSTPRDGHGRTRTESATSTWRTPWHTGARRQLRTTCTTQLTGPRRTPTRTPTPSSRSTRRRLASAMGPTSTRPPSPSTQTS
ncbi:hypothetical protein SORBI_3002G331450 [Sorghum bicolor]|uniref:Uncharacterized protein n=1 Tax=Sorghum bicolor TaxID=4558 RepID=A0A1W0W6S0_SORBI|nr:hypothetical protein SORBI_3002G331450 [Sorghum bicolor]